MAKYFFALLSALLLFLLINCSGKDYPIFNSERDVYYFCAQRFISDGEDTCFRKTENIPEDLYLYGNGLFDIWLSKNASYLNTINTIGNKHKNSWLSEMLQWEDARIKNSAIGMRATLNELQLLAKDNGKSNSLAIAEITIYTLLMEADWGEARKVLDDIPKEQIISSDTLAVTQLDFLLEDLDNEKALDFLEKLCSQQTNVGLCERGTADYLYQKGDMKGAVAMYKKSNTPEDWLKGAEIQFVFSKNEDDVDKAKSLMIKALEKMRFRADLTFGTAVFMTRYKETSFAEKIIDRFKRSCDSEARECEGGVNGDIYAAWSYALQGRSREADLIVHRALEKWPTSFEGNWLSYLICKKNKDISCQENVLSNMYKLSVCDKGVINEIKNAVAHYPNNSRFRGLLEDIRAQCAAEK